MVDRSGCRRKGAGVGWLGLGRAREVMKRAGDEGAGIW